MTSSPRRRGAAREHYAATKGGVIAMMRGLAVELARHGIRANAILPGWIETAMTEHSLGSDAQRKILPRVPMRRRASDDSAARRTWRATPAPPAATPS